MIKLHKPNDFGTDENIEAHYVNFYHSCHDHKDFAVLTDYNFSLLDCVENDDVRETLGEQTLETMRDMIERVIKSRRKA